MLCSLKLRFTPEKYRTRRPGAATPRLRPRPKQDTTHRTDSPVATIKVRDAATHGAYAAVVQYYPEKPLRSMLQKKSGLFHMLDFMEIILICLEIPTSKKICCPA